MKQLRRIQCLNGNLLKLIALVCMTVDHVGFYLFPHITVMRIIGRIAMPIFAYMIAEGCYYTRSMKRYFLTVLAVGAVCQVAMFIAAGSPYQCIMITFSLSSLLIWLLKTANRYSIEHRNGSVLLWIAFSAGLLAVFIVAWIIPQSISGSDFAFDYGFFGVLLPVLIYLPHLSEHRGIKTDTVFILRFIMMALGLALVAMTVSLRVQWWSYLAMIFILLYNGTRGKLNLKYLFYIYYPLHIGVINLISMLR